MEPYTLLVIARTQTLATRLLGALNPEQYVIRWVPSTAQALTLEIRPFLLVLDLPPAGGVRSVLRLKRRFDAPLLAICRPDSPVPSQVDASLPLPYDLDRLVELIEDTLMSHSPHMMRAGNLALDVASRRLQVNGSLYELRPTGCRIMAVLLARVGRVVPREELYRRVWNTEDRDCSRALDVHVARLRNQLEANPRRPKLILTERGIGYRLHLSL